MTRYVPKKGDFVALTFDHNLGMNKKVEGQLWL